MDSYGRKDICSGMHKSEVGELLLSVNMRLERTEQSDDGYERQIFANEKTGMVVVVVIKDANLTSGVAFAQVKWNKSLNGILNDWYVSCSRILDGKVWRPARRIVKAMDIFTKTTTPEPVPKDTWEMAVISKQIHTGCVNDIRVLEQETSFVSPYLLVPMMVRIETPVKRFQVGLFDSLRQCRPEIAKIVAVSYGAESL